jgi:hypothetical protein
MTSCTNDICSAEGKANRAGFILSQRVMRHGLMERRCSLELRIAPIKCNGTSSEMDMSRGCVQG